MDDKKLLAGLKEFAAKHPVNIVRAPRPTSAIPDDFTWVLSRPLYEERREIVMQILKPHLVKENKGETK